MAKKKIVLNKHVIRELVFLIQKKKKNGGISVPYTLLFQPLTIWKVKSLYMLDPKLPFMIDYKINFFYKIYERYWLKRR